MYKFRAWDKKTNAELKVIYINLSADTQKVVDLLVEVDGKRKILLPSEFVLEVTP
jgi:hypothetical protein